MYSTVRYIILYILHTYMHIMYTSPVSVTSHESTYHLSLLLSPHAITSRLSPPMSQHITSHCCYHLMPSPVSVTSHESTYHLSLLLSSHAITSRLSPPLSQHITSHCCYHLMPSPPACHLTCHYHPLHYM